MKTINKKIIALMVCFAVVLMLLPASSLKVKAATVVDSGTDANGINWVLTDDGTLTISGSGAMEDYTSGAPWRSHSSSISKVVIEEGVTYISIGALSYNRNIRSVSIPESVTVIGPDAFNDCIGITELTLPSGLTTIMDQGFFAMYNLKNLTIPASVTLIGRNGLYVGVRGSLEKLEFLGDVPASMGSDQFVDPSIVDYKVIVPEAYEANWRAFFESNYASYISCLEVRPSARPATPQNGPHTHSFAWVTKVEPTLSTDGVEAFTCTVCGYTECTQPIGREAAVYKIFMDSIDEQLKTTAKGERIVIDLTDWHSVPSFMMHKIINCGRDVELKYKYEGLEYDIVIKAGKGVDLNIPWYGPLLMNGLYGN